MNTLQKYILLVLALFVIIVVAISIRYNKNPYYTDPVCSQGSMCGSIKWKNDSAYNIGYVQLYAESSQPDAPINPDCADFDTSFGSETGSPLDSATFMVPADCEYKLRIQGACGTKHRYLFLTPGCSMSVASHGSCSDNHWGTVYVSWINGAPGIPTDSQGNPCEQM